MTHWPPTAPVPQIDPTAYDSPRERQTDRRTVERPPEWRRHCGRDWARGNELRGYDAWRREHDAGHNEVLRRMTAACRR